MKKSFIVEINLNEVLTAAAIWPNDDGPDNPTVADVEALFFEQADVHATCRKWGLEITRGDVEFRELASSFVWEDAREARAAAAQDQLAPVVEETLEVLSRGFGASAVSRPGRDDFVGWVALEATFQFPHGDGLVPANVRAYLKPMGTVQGCDLVEFCVSGSDAVLVEASADLFAKLMFVEARRDVDFDAAHEAM